MRARLLGAALTMLLAATLPAQRADGTLRLLDFRPETRRRVPGDDATSELVVRNLADTAQRVWLGYSVRDARGDWTDIPVRPAELAAGPRPQVLRHDWRLPVDPPPLSGPYTVVMALWSAPPGDSGATRLVSATREDAFRVEAGLVPFADSVVAGWRAASHRLGRGHMRADEAYIDGAAFRLRLAPGSCDGAEVRTTDRHHFGTFSARLRTPRAPGSISALFLYADVSDGNDEIDIELFNDGSGDALLTTWVAGVRTHELRVRLGWDPGAAFHDYRIVWSANELRFEADDVTLATLHVGFPLHPMRLMANTWWPIWLECAPPREAADLVIRSIGATGSAR